MHFQGPSRSPSTSHEGFTLGVPTYKCKQLLTHLCIVKFVLCNCFLVIMYVAVKSSFDTLPVLWSRTWLGRLGTEMAVARSQ